MLIVFDIYYTTLLLLVVTIVSYLYLTRNFDYWTKRGIKGPKPIPLFGNLFSFILKPDFDVELEWYRKYGKIYGIFRGNTPVLTVAEPELVKQIMVKEFNTFRNHREEPNSRWSLGTHIFHARDNEWKALRAISTPAFSSKKLKNIYSLISECCDEFMANLDGFARDRSEIELKKHYGAYTMDVIAKVAFATNTNAYKNPKNEFTKQANATIYVKNWKMILYILLPNCIAKYIRQLINVGSDSKIFFADIGRHLIRQRKANNETHNDFLQLLMDAERDDELIGKTDEITKNHGNEGIDEIIANTKALSKVFQKKLTDDQILSTCYFIFVAGYHTTSTTLALCTYEIALNNAVQQNLYKEAKAAINGKESIDFETLMTLPYLDAVISETLRKYPPTIRLNRQASNDTVLGDTGIKITKGLIVEVPNLVIQHDPQNYPNPDEFIPERFLSENRHNLKPYTYLPFGVGPRNCIALRLALLESKLALFNLILKFQVFSTPNTTVPIQWQKSLRSPNFENIFIGIKTRE